MNAEQVKGHFNNAHYHFRSSVGNVGYAMPTGWKQRFLMKFVTTPGVARPSINPAL